MSRYLSLLALTVSLVGCVSLGPASREGLGTPYPSVAAARAAADSIGAPVIVVVDTVVWHATAELPPQRDVARVRLVRGGRASCVSHGGDSAPCPTTIFIETRRPQWKPR